MDASYKLKIGLGLVVLAALIVGIILVVNDGAAIVLSVMAALITGIILLARGDTTTVLSVITALIAGILLSALLVAFVAFVVTYVEFQSLY